MNRAALAALLLCASAALHAEIQVTGAWARATVPGATVAAGYLTITNTGSESRTLLRLTTTVCDMLLLHQTTIDAQGVARMWPMAKLELEPGQTVRFEPNGKHLMFRELKSPLRVGDRVPVTFEFEGESPVTVQMEVRPLTDAGPAKPGATHHP